MSNTRSMSIDNLKSIIDDHYVLYKLNEFWKCCLQDFFDSNPDLVKKYKIPGFATKVPKKRELVDIYAICFSTEELFKAMIGLMPSNLQVVFKQAVWGRSFSQEELQQDYKLDIINYGKFGGYGRKHYQEIKAEYQLFSTHSEYKPYYWQNDKKETGMYNHTLYIHPDLAAYFTPFLDKPAGYYLEPVAKLRETTHKFSSEQIIFQELPIANAYIQQDRLAITKTGRVTDAALNKMRKFCNIQEFFPESKDKALTNYRTRMLALLALRWNKRRGKNKSLIEMIKALFEDFQKGSFKVPDLVSHTKNWHNVPEVNHDISKYIFAALEDFSTDGWITYKNFSRYFVYRQIYFDFVSSSYYYEYIQYSTKKNGYTDTVRISDRTYYSLLKEPYIKNCLFLLAALGILEVAYDAPTSADESLNGAKYVTPGDNIQYIRLTPLGAAMLGKIDNYTPPEVKEEKVVLDQENLFLLYSGDNKSLVSMIESVAVKISDKLYKVSFESVLGSCSNIKEVTNQISVFKHLLSKNPPKIWQEFFDALTQKSYRLNNQNNEYLIYKLPQNPELIRLIAKDDFLRKHIIKAEYHNVLIPQKHKTKVKNYLKKSGFLIEFD